MPPTSSSASSDSASQRIAGLQTTAPGEFSDAARSLTTRDTTGPLREDSGAAQNRMTDAGTLAEAFDDTPESDSDLGTILAAIADDVQAAAEGARSGIRAEYGARIAYARKYLRGPARAAAIGALKQGRAAALALVSRNAAQELAGRKKAVLGARGRRPRPNGRKPHRNAPQRH